MIIIETTTRERLVLVPEERIVCTEHTRDATPEDLARGGFVLREQAAPGTLAHLRADLRDMTARAEKAELDAAEWAAEVDALRAEALAELADARRERDTLLAELADAKAECQGAMLSAYAQYAETVRERDEARAELARLAAPAEGEPTDEELHAAWWTAAGGNVEAHRAVYRLGVAHERARQQPAMGSATDEELERVYSNAYARAWESELSTPDRGERAGVLAVAARVRQERCLVTRAVGMLADVSLARHPQRGLGERTYTIRVQCPAEPNAIAAVPAADVPATLARLLGEVER